MIGIRHYSTFPAKFSEKLYGVALTTRPVARSAAPPRLFGTPLRDPVRFGGLTGAVRSLSFIGRQSVTWSGLLCCHYSGFAVDGLACCLILQHEQGEAPHLLPG